MKKKYFFLAALLLLVGGLQTANAQKMKVRMTDNQVVEFNLTQVADVTFEEADEQGSDDYEWVDLGLPSGTLWATCNVGASKPEDDAATANWGSGWQMPSIAQQQELINSSYTTTEWTTVNGVNGRKITSRSNGNSIFLPAAGIHYDTSLYNAGGCGYYWSRSLGTSDSDDVRYLYFGSGYIYTYINDRSDGFTVRPVRVD